MTTIHSIQEKIAETLGDLYEAFYVAQAWIEEREFIDTPRRPLQSLRGFPEEPKSAA